MDDASAPRSPKTRRPTVRAVGLAATVALGWLALPSAGPATAATIEKPSAVWVFFHDKGELETGPTRAVALLAREVELPSRTLERRKRSRGDRGVDGRDLPLDSDYVAHVEATGATIRVQSRWLNAVSVEATPSQRAALSSLAEVARVEPVRRRNRIDDPMLQTLPPIPFHGGDEVFGLSTAQLELIGADVLQRNCGLTGAGVVVGVQDTGFDLSHQAFGEVNVLDSYDFINDDPVVSNEPGDPGSQINHGTLVLGTLAGSEPGVFMGVAPGIDVLLSKTEQTNAEVPAEEDYYVAGLEWIEMQGADIFTASLGYTDWYGPDDFDGLTAVTTVAVNTAFDNGLLVFASGGNSGPGASTIIAPADAFGALAVGATTLGGNVTGFSSRGPTSDGRIKPDISAPGAQVASVEVGTLDQYTTWNGTSAAAPVAAGLAALIMEARPELTAQEMFDLLRDTASQSGMPDNELGWGIIDGVLASGDACGCNDGDGDGFVGMMCGGDDCADDNADVNPDAEEICDGLDNNCNGSVHSAELDEDGDGVSTCAGDCDDNEAMAAPGLEEICGDGIDNDCQDGDEPCPASEGPLDDSGGGASSDGGGGTGVGTLTSGEVPGGTGQGDDSTGDDAGAADGGGDGGCGCSSSDERPLPGLALLLLTLGVWRRRR